MGHITHFVNAISDSFINPVFIHLFFAESCCLSPSVLPGLLPVVLVVISVVGEVAEGGRAISMRSGWAGADVEAVRLGRLKRSEGGTEGGRTRTYDIRTN